MSLRLRITLLVIALLAAVLLGAGWSFVRAEEREFERETMARMRHQVFAGMRRLRPPSRSRGMPSDPFDALDPPVAELEPQPDGAHAEVMTFFRPEGEPPRLMGRAATGDTRLEPEAVARLLPSIAPDRLTVVRLDESPYYVFLPPLGRGRGPEGGPGGRPGPDAGDRPGPPPRPEPFGPGERGRRGARRAQSLLQPVGLLEQGPPRQVLTARIRRAATIGLLALVLGAGLAFLLAGRMLRPVRRAAESAEAIDSAEQRLPEPTQKDELGRLINVLNAMLGRIEEGAQRERTFLATASHELRRPLAALRGEIELALRKDRSVDDLREALQHSLGDAKAMGRLVDDLLLHARSRAGAAPLVEEDVDWVDLVTEAVARSSRAMPDAFRIEVRELPDVHVHGDRLRLGQVVENLVTNAGTHGGPSSHVVVDSQVDETGLRLIVEDDGGGIAASDVDSIFEPFGRGDGTRSVPGSGLGLAIAKDGVEAHGGRIQVASPIRAEGGGTRFLVHLPAARVVRS